MRGRDFRCAHPHLCEEPSLDPRHRRSVRLTQPVRRQQVGKPIHAGGNEQGVHHFRGQGVQVGGVEGGVWGGGHADYLPF